jgi:hypothetical protein
LHAPAKAWLEARLSGTETIAIPWTVLLAFIRLTTRAGLFRNPMPVEVCLDLIDSWLEQPPVIVIEPGPRHWMILKGLLAATGAAGNLTSDAHLAALAVEHRAELYSFDQDFSRFPDLKWHNPLG